MTGLGLLLALGMQFGCVHDAPLTSHSLISQDVAHRLLPPPGVTLDLNDAISRNPPSPSPDKPDGGFASERQPEPVLPLPDAIAFALRNSPRLLAARAAIEKARGQEMVAFAPFLPDVQFNTRYGVTSGNLSPGSPSITGGILIDGLKSHRFYQAELQLQWTICDFGRTAGRYGRAVLEERIAELRRGRAGQTVTYDVAAAYLQVLLAAASKVVQEDAIRAAESTLRDAKSRLAAGNADKDDVLRAEVRLSETREDLVLARDEEWNSVARLNNVMGRNASTPARVVDWRDQTPFELSLAQCLELASQQRLEIGVVRDGIAAARQELKAVEAEFCPRIYVLATLGYVDGQVVQDGWQEGAGIRLEQGLFRGGARFGEVKKAEADIQLAVANGQAVLDAVSLEVTLAFRSVVSTRERIGLARPAVEQARENLRLVRVKARNGDATPTDLVDAESSLTRSQQRYIAALYEYLNALARMEYALGGAPGNHLKPPPEPPAEELPPPRKDPQVR